MNPTKMLAQFPVLLILRGSPVYLPNVLLTRSENRKYKVKDITIFQFTT